MQMGDPMELTFEGLEIEKRNLPTDRVQRADEKNWVTCSTIISISGSLGKIIKCIWNFYFALSENGLCYWILPLAWCQFLKIKNFGIFSWLTTDHRSLPTVPFSKRTLSGAFKYLTQTVTKFLLLSAKRYKNSPF